MEDNTQRGTGRTTRLVDEAIQVLFTNGEVTVTDHQSDVDYANKDLMKRVLRRLRAEHAFRQVTVDHDTRTIKLVKFLKR